MTRKSKVYTLSENQFRRIIENSSNLNDAKKKIGGGAAATIRKRMDELNLKFPEDSSTPLTQTPRKNGDKPSPPVQLKRQPPQKSQTRSSRSIAALVAPEFMPIYVSAGVAGLLLLGVFFAVNQSAAQPTTNTDAQKSIEQLMTELDKKAVLSESRMRAIEESARDLQKNLSDLQSTVAEKGLEIDRLRTEIPKLEDTKVLLSEITQSNEQFRKMLDESQKFRGSFEEVKQSIENVKKEYEAQQQQFQQWKNEATLWGPNWWSRIATGMLYGIGGFFGAQVLPLGKNEIIKQTGIAATFATLGFISNGWPFSEWLS